MQRLGKNQGRYHGETIDIDKVQAEAHRLALAKGWSCETFLEDRDAALRGYHRMSNRAKRNLYLSAGIHGDEPAGPLAMLELLGRDRWPADANLWIVPSLNPTGFRLNTRENQLGIDLNRDYRHFLSKEVTAHVQWLEKLPRFDLALILHEDWEANGFYVYELNPVNAPTLAEVMVDSVRELCPIEISEQVDNWTCRAGIIRPDVAPEDREQWAEAIYLAVHKTGQTYTTETPSDYSLPTRVEAQVRAVESALNTFGSLGQTAL